VTKHIQRRWQQPKVAQWRMELREKVSKAQGHQCMVCMQSHHLLMMDGLLNLDSFLLCDLCAEVCERITNYTAVEDENQMKRLIILAHGKYCKG